MIICVQARYKPTEPNMAIFCIFAYSIGYILWPQLSTNPGTLDFRKDIPCELHGIFTFVHVNKYFPGEGTFYFSRSG